MDLAAFLPFLLCSARFCVVGLVVHLRLDVSLCFRFLNSFFSFFFQTFFLSGGDPGRDGVLPSSTPQEILQVQAARITLP